MQGEPSVLHVMWVFYSIIVFTGKTHGEYGVCFHYTP